jgi:hypothetical protein
MKPFIPPKDSDEDFNWEIDMMIEEEIERRPFHDDEQDIRDSYDVEDADDLRNINIG